jgi:hypothetical protein
MTHQITSYTRSHFQNICHTTNFPNLLTQQNYGDIGKILEKEILKNCK